jgi:hypothetical protein
MHESRTDYAQLLTSIFLLVAGPGSWPLDALLRRQRGHVRTRKARARGRPHDDVTRRNDPAIAFVTSMMTVRSK